MSQPHDLKSGGPLSGDDHRAIEAVILRYATGIDTRDWALFRTCFADDVSADYGPFGQWRSGDEITATMEGMHAEMGATLHRITNVVVTPITGGAKARSYVDAMLTSRTPGEAEHQGIGFYDDELIRTEAGWKIAARKFTAVRLT